MLKVYFMLTGFSFLKVVYDSSSWKAVKKPHGARQIVTYPPLFDQSVQTYVSARAPVKKRRRNWRKYREAEVYVAWMYT